LRTEPPAYPPVPLEGDWYFETERLGFAQGVRVRNRLLQTTTQFQQLEIIETEAFGRALVLDRALQTSEGDEFMYHEMLVHVPLITHPAPRRVLIIGGGDGGTLRRVLEHRGTEPTQVEIDGGVIDACKQYLPSVSAGALDDPRARVLVQDGIPFMRENAGTFDVVIVDSTDPIGPAVELFEAPFYQNVARSLADDGLMVAQSSLLSSCPMSCASRRRTCVRCSQSSAPTSGVYPPTPGRSGATPSARSAMTRSPLPGTRSSGT
jgi:spermidine synthase